MSATASQYTFPSTLKLTDPVGTPKPLGTGVTLAVNVTPCPNTVGFNEDVTEVNVAGVGVAVGVAVGVFVGVAVGVAVGVFVGVAVGVAVGVFVGVAVGVAVGVLVGVAVGVAVGVFVGVAVGAVSSLTIVPWPTESENVPLSTLSRFTVKVSFVSNATSPFTLTVTCLVVSSDVNVTEFPLVNGKNIGCEIG